MEVTPPTVNAMRYLWLAPPQAFSSHPSEYVTFSSYLISVVICCPPWPLIFKGRMGKIPAKLQPEGSLGMAGTKLVLGAGWMKLPVWWRLMNTSCIAYEWQMVLTWDFQSISIYFNWISRKGTWDILSLVFFLSRCRFTDVFRASVTNLHQSHVAGLSSRRAILWKVFVLVQHSMLPDLIRSFGGAWLLLFAIDYSNYAIHETTWNIQKPFMRLCHSARVFWSLRLMLNNRLRCRIYHPSTREAASDTKGKPRHIMSSWHIRRSKTEKLQFALTK